MPAAKIAEAAHLCRWLDRTGNDPFERSAHLPGQGFNHRVSCFADGYNQCARIRLQIVKIFADAQQSALAMHMPVEGFGNRSLVQCELKNLARSLSHLAKLGFMIGNRKHAGDYKDATSSQPSANSKNFRPQQTSQRFCRCRGPS